MNEARNICVWPVGQWGASWPRPPRGGRRRGTPPCPANRLRYDPPPGTSIWDKFSIFTTDHNLTPNRNKTCFSQSINYPIKLSRCIQSTLTTVDLLTMKTPKQNVVVSNTHFVNYCPSNLFSGSSPHPLTLLPNSKKYSEVWGGGGFELCWRPFLQEFITLFLTRFRNYKIALPPQTKS